jgi:endonuclease YncB( thermonuclease family)
MILPFLCLVASVYDGDTLTCASGEKVRLSAISAREIRGNRCAPSHPCPRASAQAAKAALGRMVRGKVLTCRQTGRSWGRITARCSVNGVDVSCAMIRGGWASWWKSYDRRNELRRCVR